MAQRIFHRIVVLSRTLHIYLTMFAFVLMMFLALTGLTLNHEEWFTGNEAPPVETTGTIPIPLLKEPDKLMIVERLRSEYGATGAVSTFDVEDDQLRVEMKGPGRRTEAEIDRATGQTRMTSERRGFVVRMDDLHRGKDTGLPWRILLDLSSLLLLLGSVTGILMWCALKRRRRLGMIALAGSVAIFVVTYFFFVP